MKKRFSIVLSAIIVTLKKCKKYYLNYKNEGKKFNISDITNFIVGNYRYELYYSDESNKLMFSHILEQIALRINSMDVSCINKGSCKECGCETTQLQMCNKSCDGLCYPKMLNLSKFNSLKRGDFIIIDNTKWKIKDGKFKKSILG